MSLSLSDSLTVLSDSLEGNRGEDRLAAHVADVEALLDEDLEALEAELRRAVADGPTPATDAARHLVTQGGKRVRPLALLLSAACFGRVPPAARELAVVAELVHSATLLHDDVVDESELRRGRQTANAAFGNPASVLVGDFLYSRAFQMMVEVDDMRVMSVLADATNTIAEGEVLQLMNCHDADIDIPRYLQVIRYKTAKLFEAAARLGAILSGAPAEIEEGMARYGMHLGTAFQLVVDVLDYSGDEAATGKHLGDDLAEGKPTLPLIHAMKHGSVDQSACVRHAIEEGGREALPGVLAAIRGTGALDETRRHAEAEARVALEAVAPLPASTFKDSLVQLTSFAVARDF